MLNLVPAIKTLEEMIRKRQADYEKEIKPYSDSLAALRKINEACEFCDGTGKILRTRACAEDDAPDPNDPRDWRDCAFCDGTGRKLKHD